MLKNYNELLRIIIRLEPSLCVVSSWVIKRVYTILISNTISGSSNLDICFYYCLIITLISHLKYLFNSLLHYIYIYSWPPCRSTPILSGYLLLWHSCIWDKTSTLWSCQHARLSSFSWLRGHRNLQISRTMRSILPFLFSLYDEYTCFLMFIFNYCLVWLLERTLSYYSNQSIIKFAIKTKVVIFKLVKQLSLIIMMDLCY